MSLAELMHLSYVTNEIPVHLHVNAWVFERTLLYRLNIFRSCFFLLENSVCLPWSHKANKGVLYDRLESHILSNTS